MKAPPKRKKKKAGFTAEDWPKEGAVNDNGYCTTCKTYWCPHARPRLYQ